MPLGTDKGVFMVISGPAEQSKFFPVGDDERQLQYDISNMAIYQHLLPQIMKISGYAFESGLNLLCKWKKQVLLQYHDLPHRQGALAYP